MNKFFLLALGVAGILGACTTAELATAQSDISTGIQAACKDVQATAVAFPGSPVAVYATGACGSAELVSALVQNSGTIQWLGQIQAQLKVPATTTPAS